MSKSRELFLLLLVHVLVWTAVFGMIMTVKSCMEPFQMVREIHEKMGR